MAKSVTLLEQHLDKQPTTVVIQDITWWEVVIAHVKQQQCGLGMHLPVKVYECFYTTYACAQLVQAFGTFVLSVKIERGPMFTFCALYIPKKHNDIVTVYFIAPKVPHAQVLT